MSVLDMFSMKGKCGFVTGGSRGIGYAVAKALAEAGADVALVATNMAIAEKAAEDIRTTTGRNIIAIGCDVTKPEEVDAMMAIFLETYKTIDFAVNNAGIFNGFAVEEISPEEFKAVLDVNLNGVFLTAQAAAKAMLKEGKKGSIISTASMSGHIVNVPQTIANYCASKAAVIHLSKAMAVEWAERGIRVNTVSPGYITTELVAELTDMHPIWNEMVPMKRLGTVEDLVGAYLYLASDASRYTTGSDIIVDGGYCCR